MKHHAKCIFLSPSRIRLLVGEPKNTEIAALSTASLTWSFVATFSDWPLDAFSPENDDSALAESSLSLGLSPFSGVNSFVGDISFSF